MHYHNNVVTITSGPDGGASEVPEALSGFGKQDNIPTWSTSYKYVKITQNYDIHEVTTTLIVLYLQRQKEQMKFSECSLSMPDGSHSPLYLKAKGFHLPANLNDTLLAVYGGIQLDDGTIAHAGDTIKSKQAFKR